MHSSGNLFQSFTTLWENVYFLISNLEWLFTKARLCPLVMLSFFILKNISLFNPSYHIISYHIVVRSLVERICPVPPPQTHGQVDACSRHHLFGSTCVYACHSGYHLPEGGVASVQCVVRATTEGGKVTMEWDTLPAPCTGNYPPAYGPQTPSGRLMCGMNVVTSTCAGQVIFITRS